jgi:hypothetical protein
MTERGQGHLSIERFIEELRWIAPRADVPVQPDSDLIADLKFDALAFAQLGVLLYEHYGRDGAGIAAELQARDTATVESVFRRFILRVANPA